MPKAGTADSRCGAPGVVSARGESGRRTAPAIRDWQSPTPKPVPSTVLPVEWASSCRWAAKSSARSGAGRRWSWTRLNSRSGAVPRSRTTVVRWRCWCCPASWCWGVPSWVPRSVSAPGTPGSSSAAVAVPAACSLPGRWAARGGRARVPLRPGRNPLPSVPCGPAYGSGHRPADAPGVPPRRGRTPGCRASSAPTPVRSGPSVPLHPTGSMTSNKMRRSRATPREAWDRAVPTGHPSTSATCFSDRSW